MSVAEPLELTVDDVTQPSWEELAASAMGGSILDSDHFDSCGCGSQCLGDACDIRCDDGNGG